MSLLKNVLAAAVNIVAPRPQSYLVTENAEGFTVYKPMGALYTPENPPPREPKAEMPQVSSAEQAARLTI
jgi:hypothetical protein